MQTSLPPEKVTACCCAHSPPCRSEHAFLAAAMCHLRSEAQKVGVSAVVALISTGAHGVAVDGSMHVSLEEHRQLALALSADFRGEALRHVLGLQQRGGQA